MVLQRRTSLDHQLTSLTLVCQNREEQTATAGKSPLSNFTTASCVSFNLGESDIIQMRRTKTLIHQPPWLFLAILNLTSRHLQSRIIFIPQISSQRSLLLNQSVDSLGSEQEITHKHSVLNREGRSFLHKN